MTLRPKLAAVSLVVLVLPRLAWACPMCANQRAGGVARIAALGVMLLLPFAITFLVFRWLRRTGESENEARSAGPAHGAVLGEPAAAHRERRP